MQKSLKARTTCAFIAFMLAAPATAKVANTQPSTAGGHTKTKNSHATKQPQTVPRKHSFIQPSPVAPKDPTNPTNPNNYEKGCFPTDPGNPITRTFYEASSLLDDDTKFPELKHIIYQSYQKHGTSPTPTASYVKKTCEQLLEYLNSNKEEPQKTSLIHSSSVAEQERLKAAGNGDLELGKQRIKKKNLKINPIEEEDAFAPADLMKSAFVHCFQTDNNGNLDKEKTKECLLRRKQSFLQANAAIEAGEWYTQQRTRTTAVCSFLTGFIIPAGYWIYHHMSNLPNNAGGR